MRRYKALGTFGRLWGLAEVAALAVAAALAGFSRMYLGYHNEQQVLAGAVLGLALGWAWLQLSAGLAHTFAAAAQLPLFRVLGFRDTWSVADVIAVEQRLFADNSKLE